MCGIAGFYSQGKSLSQETIVRMRDALRHRGPDDDGIYISSAGSCALVHTRLSILDLTEMGHQPMSCRESRFFITYNGEVYNFVELREELMAKGYNFLSRTDTEVVLYSFIEWGEECQKRFNGMWAFAIWDEKDRSLFVSRDRFGIKPLYYFWDGELFLFASEIRALLECELIDREINYKSVAYFIETGLVDGTEDTFFKGIKRLSPGCSLLLRDSLKVEKRYWELRITTSEIGEEEAKERCLFLFEDSIRLSQRSDVPLGICLSGGIDSSSIYSIIAQKFREAPRTFSVYYDDPEFDERLFIDEMTKETREYHYYIKPGSEDLLETCKKIVWHLEEPPKATGVFSQWNVVKLARDHVKVLLDGQGGDEVWAGYDYYRPYLIAELFKKNPFAALAAYRNILSFGHSSIKTELLNYARLRFFDPKGIILHLLGKDCPYCIDFRFSAPYMEFQQEKKRYEITSHSLNERLAIDVTREMLPALLKYEDKIGMAFSLESRIPFLDYRLVELAFSLPSHLKCHPSGWTKYIFRRAMESLLPQKVVWRKDKKGFPTPMNWLITNHGKEVKKRIRENSLIKFIFCRDFIDNILTKGFTGEENRLLWQWYSLVIWHELFFNDKI